MRALSAPAFLARAIAPPALLASRRLLSSSGGGGGDEGSTCVIGAGVGGLTAARYLRALGVRTTLLEASAHCGGTWRFDPRAGCDQRGLPLFTHMYKYLRTNTPSQTMELPGLPLPPDTPTFPTGEAYYRYLEAFVTHFRLRDCIQFESYVTSVVRERGRWSVSYKSAGSDSVHCEEFSHVVVATGQYRKVNWPALPGEEAFTGKIIHGHDYKEPEAFRGRRVLLVGAGASGLDLAVQLVEHAALLVHSHHLSIDNRYCEPVFPRHYVRKPDVERLTAAGARFVDGTFAELDDVIYCTGYLYDIPFLDASCGVTVFPDHVVPLYRQTVNLRHPTMFLLGMIKSPSIIRAVDAQAEYAARAIAGKFSLPSVEAMLDSWLHEVRDLRARGAAVKDINHVGEAHDEFLESLHLEGGVARVPPVLSALRSHNARARLQDLLHYRDYEIQLLDEHHYQRIYRPWSAPREEQAQQS